MSILISSNMKFPFFVNESLSNPFLLKFSTLNIHHRSLIIVRLNIYLTLTMFNQDILIISFFIDYFDLYSYKDISQKLLLFLNAIVYCFKHNLKF